MYYFRVLCTDRCAVHTGLGNGYGNFIFILSPVRAATPRRVESIGFCASRLCVQLYAHTFVGNARGDHNILLPSGRPIAVKCPTFIA